MSEEHLRYATYGAIATITLDRPASLNAAAGRDDPAASTSPSRRQPRSDAIKVIVLQGAGDAFCAGFDFSDGLDHAPTYREDGYDPGLDVFRRPAPTPAGSPASWACGGA